MTRLSNRQFPMLEALCSQRDTEHMTIEQAQRFDQRPFRSMLIRGWCVYKRGKGFHVTQAGLDAMNEFRNTTITRKNPSLPLTRYFDPTAYGLAAPKKPAVYAMQKRGAA